MIFFQAGDDEMSYQIRKMSNFNVVLYTDELDFGDDKENMQLTIDLVYFQPAQHNIQDLDLDILLC